MRAGIYARVSSQAQRDAHTIESQLQTVPAWCRAQGWTVVEQYVDDGRTAKAGHLERRDGLRRLLADAAAGRLDVVAVVDQDRLSRAEDLIERAAILGALQRAGVRLAVSSTGQVLDLSTSHGDLLANLGAYFAAEENRKRRERTVRGKLTAISRGRKPSGPTPYGLRFDRATGAWSLDPDEAAIVREIYRRVIAGEVAYAIAVDLQRRGVARARGGAWQRDRVYQIATSPTYRGEWPADRARGLVVSVPAIVDAATWVAAQQALALRRPPNWSRGRHVNLIQGLGVCELCGAPIGVTGSQRGWRYYLCRDKRRARHERPPGPRCPNPIRRVEQLDEDVWRAVAEVITDPHRLARAAALRLDHQDTTDWQAEARDYERRLERLERAEAAILERYRRGRISQGALDRELAAAERDRALLARNRDLAREQAGRAHATRERHASLAATVERLRARVEAASPAERRDLIVLLTPRALGCGVTIGPQAVVVDGLLPLRSPFVVPSTAAGCSSGVGDNVRFRVVAA